MPLIDFMLWLEQLAYHIQHVSHPSRGVHLDVVRRSAEQVVFEFTRAPSSSAVIKVLLNTGGKHTRSVSIKDQKVDDLGDLKDCICASLSPSLRVLNLLKLIMKDHLKLVFMDEEVQQKKLLVVSKGNTEVWLDKDDALKVKGGSCLEGIRTYTADKKGPGHKDKKVFYFEDPFAKKESGAVHALMPGTLLFLSDVLGTLGFETLDEWTKPVHQQQRHEVHQQRRQEEPGMTIVEAHGSGQKKNSMPHVGRGDLGG